MCASMVDIQSAAAEIMRGKKIEERKKKDINHRAKIYWPALLHRAAIISFIVELQNAKTALWPLQFESKRCHYTTRV